MKLKFYIIGAGNQTTYQALAKKLGIAGAIEFIGDSDQVPAYMQASDLLLHPAQYESAGMVLVEALSFGLPVLVTDTCGYAFHIRDAKAGVVLEAPFNQKVMNDSLKQLLAHDVLQGYSKNALIYANSTDLYSMDKICLNHISA